MNRIRLSGIKKSRKHSGKITTH